MSAAVVLFLAFASIAFIGTLLAAVHDALAALHAGRSEVSPGMAPPAAAALRTVTTAGRPHSRPLVVPVRLVRSASSGHTSLRA